MARDVEYNVTGSDKSGPSLESAARKFAAAQAKMRKDQEATDKSFGKSLLATANAVAPKLTAKLTDAFSAVAPAAVPILAGIGIVAAPGIGAAVAGAIIGAAGIGGVLGGLALVSRDARVNAAGKALGERLLGGLSQDAATFIAPALDAIDTIGDAFDRQRERFQSIFANASRYVAPLTQGLVDFLAPVIRGFDALVAKAAPVISAIKVGFGQVGDAIEDLFVSLADNGEEAGVALTFVFTALATSIRIVGQIINALTETFGFFLKGIPAAAQAIPGLDSALRGAKETTDATNSSAIDLSGAFNKVAEETTGATAAQVDYVAQAAQVTSANRSLYSSNTDVAAAIKDATDKINDNGRGLSVNSEKGRANRTVLANLASTLSANYDAYVKVNGAGDGATAVMKRNRDAFQAAATKAGLAADKAKALADQLLGIKSRTVNVNVVFNESRINAVENRLNRLGNGAYSAATGWGSLDGNSTTSRTGGPTKVHVDQALTVNLDGAPFTQLTATQISANNRRQAWRARVGVRA